MKPSAPPPVPDYGAPARRAPDRRLSPAQIAFFEENGYLAIDAIMPAEEIALVRAIYDRLFNEDRGRTEADLYNLTGPKEAGRREAVAQILQPAKYAPELLETQMVANLKAMMRQLLGPETRMVGDHAINKPPHSDAPTPWHQDEAYWDPAKDYRSLSVWVPLQPATKANGCMHFVPGSQRLEVIAHRPIGNDPRVPGLEVVPGTFDFSAAVACELPPGGATFHTGRTLHYTPGNRSGDFRRAYIAMGSAYERPRAAPRDYPWRATHAAAAAAQHAKKSG